MHITVLGLLLVPLSLLWVMRPIRLLQLGLVAAIFEAAAALVFGSFGLQPAMVPGLLFIMFVGLQYAVGMRYPGEGRVLSALIPLLALVIYAVVSAWLLPDAFAGQVFVEPQKQDPLGGKALVPLQFNFGNVTQTLYLTFNVAFAAAVAIFLTRRAISYRSIIAAYLLGGYIVVVLVFWQFASRIGGVPFPDDLLYSNPGWAIVNQAVGSVPRIQASFSEPAGLAGYLSGITFCTLWLCIRGYRTMRPDLLLPLSVVSTLLSTSTTGLVALAVGIPITIILASVGGDPGALRRLGKTLASFLLAGLIVAGPIFVLRPSLMTSVDLIFDSTLDKGQSQSYDERTASDIGALNTLAPTYGLGVGWGSYRSSSLIPGLLANGGLFGLVMAVWLTVRVIRLGRRGRAASPVHPGRVLVDGFSASLCSQLWTALLAAPMINSMIFFLQLGCVVGVLTRMTIEQPVARRVPVRQAGWRTIPTR